MPSLIQVEQSIFDVDGIRVALSGPVTGLQDYWVNRMNGDKSVSEFKTRFFGRYPNVDIELCDGLGRVANGNRMMKNLRVTYEFDWIQESTAAHDQYMVSLKNALRAATQAGNVALADPDPYEILSVNRNSTDQEIKDAHRVQIRRFHTDRLGGMGLDAAFIQFGNERSQLINRARDQIAEERAEAEEL